MIPSRSHTVLLIDGHSIWCHGIAAVLSRESDLTVCGHSYDVGAGLESIPALDPAIIIMDIVCEVGLDLGMIKRILAPHPKARILVLSLSDENLYAERVIRAGARGYLMKQESADLLVRAVREVIRGGIYLSGRMRDILLNKALSPADNSSHNLSSLSDREMQVFTLLGEGRGNGEIARQMSVSLKTIDAYRAHLKQKLKLRSGLELMRFAILHSQPYATSASVARAVAPSAALLSPSVSKISQISKAEMS